MRPSVLSLLCGLLVLPVAFSGTLSVTDFGAVADDGKDDAPAINQAIAEAKPGDVVEIPEGRFVLASRLDLKGEMVLRGAGREKTQLVHAGQKPHSMVRATEMTDIELTGFALDGASSPHALQGIVVSKCEKVRVHHIAIRDFVDTGKYGPHAILFSRTSNSVISDNLIENIAPEDPWGAGMRVGDDCSGNQILRNRIHGTGRGGIFTNGRSTDAVIRENVITGSHGIAFAIEVHSGSVRTVVEDNIVDHGLSIVSPNCAVRRNIVLDPSGTWGSYGIEGGGGPDGVVTDNVIDYGQQQGISLSGATHHMLWARNRFTNCSQWGIQIQGAAEDKQIRRLYFYQNTFSRTKKGHPSARYPGHDGHAIRFNNHVAHVVFDSNRITDNAGQAIQVTSGKDVNHLSFVNNIITNNGQAAIPNYPGDTVIWEGNLVSGNGEDTPFVTKGANGTAPKAAFTAPATARVGEPVQFQSTSTPGDDPIDHVLWDFGAGVPATETAPTYTYERAGAYVVSLVVWDKTGRAALAKSHTIRVAAR